MIYQLLMDTGAEFLAFVFGIIFFRKLNLFFRIIAIQVFVAVFSEMLGFVFKEYGIRNAPVFNFYLLLDCSILLYAVSVYLKPRISIFIPIVVFVIYLFFWLYFIRKNGIFSFSVETYILDSILLLVAYMALFYYAIINYKESIIYLPEFWTCLGIILFYGCNIPYFSMVPYLNKQFTIKENLAIFNILRVLISLRYLLIALSFIMFYKQNNTPQKPIKEKWDRRF